MSQEARTPFSPTVETTEVFSLRVQPDGREKSDVGRIDNRHETGFIRRLLCAGILYRWS